MNEVDMPPVEFEIRNSKFEILPRRLGRVNLALTAVLLTLGLTGAVYFASGGTMFSPGELKAEPRAGVPCGEVRSHADLSNNCAACHAPPWSGDTMANRCLECHGNVRQQIDARGPLHGRLTEAMECRACHTEHKGPHAALTSLARFDHNCTAFKLTGAHRKTNCQSCHTTPGYQLTSKFDMRDSNLIACVSCHAEPQVHKGKFGTACSECHSTSTWMSTPVSLKNVGFNHDLTGFKLTGKHGAVDCQSCHGGDTFKGKSQACVSCHAEPAVHKSRFGTTCTQCHTTNTWDGAMFNHNTAFKLPHEGRNFACSACHTDQANYKSYTCIDCHEHRPDRIVLRHRGKSLDSIKNCVDCHAPNRRRNAAASAAAADLAMSEVCPVSDLKVSRTAYGLVSCPVVRTGADFAPRSSGFPVHARHSGPMPDLKAMLELLNPSNPAIQPQPARLVDLETEPVSRNSLAWLTITWDRRPGLNFEWLLPKDRLNGSRMGKSGK